MAVQFSDPTCNARMDSYMRPNGTATVGGNGSTIYGSGVYVTPGLQPQSLNFTSGCGAVGILHNASLYHGNETATANVFKFTDINDISGGSVRTFVTLSSCDGTEVFNASTPGVFVVKGQAAVIYVERRRVDGGNASACEGGSTVLFGIESLERYCGLGYSVPECKTTTAISPAAPTYKRSLALTLFTACATLAASIIA